MHNLRRPFVTTRPAYAAFARRAALTVLSGAMIACGGATDKRVTTDSANARLGDSLSTIGAMMEKTEQERVAEKPSVASVAMDQQHVLDELGALGGKPIETLSASVARKQPSPTDAVLALLRKQGKATTPEAVGSVVNRTIPTAAGSLPARVYTPAGEGPFPVIVFYHGGGFVIATMDTYDGSARALANAAGAVLIAIEYRKAPEHKFPAAHDDAFAAYLWAIANASKIHGDSSRIALVGESAGGNLAVATAVMARDKHLQMPTSILAVYPIAGTDTNTDSYRENADAKPLSRAMMAWFLDKYMRSPADGQNPRLNLLGAELKGLPPTTIVNAQIDPLRTDGELLAARLKDAGVAVDHKQFDGVAHEFFGQGAVVPAAKEAVAFGANSLKVGFKK